MCTFKKSIMTIENIVNDMALAVKKYFEGNKKLAVEKYYNVYDPAKNDDSIPSSSKGVYVFVMTDKFSINDNFNDDKYSSKQNSNDNTFEEARVLYVGKTFDAKKRIGEHYSDEGDKAPYSLKLMSKNRNKIEDKVKCVFFELKKDFCDIGTSMKSEEILIPSIEEKLHESLIPYIGTKRK